MGEVSTLAAGLGKVCTQDVGLMVLTWLSEQERRGFKGCLLLQSTRSLFSGRCPDVAVDGHEQPVPNSRSPVLGLAQRGGVVEGVAATAGLIWQSALDKSRRQRAQTTYILKLRQVWQCWDTGVPRIWILCNQRKSEIITMIIKNNN